LERKTWVTKRAKFYVGKAAAMDAVTEMIAKCFKGKTNAKFEVLTAVLLKIPCH